MQEYNHYSRAATYRLTQNYFFFLWAAILDVERRLASYKNI